MNEIVIPNNKFEIMLSNKDVIEIQNEEYIGIDSFLKKGNKGLIRLRNGEWINPSYVVMIKKMKPVAWVGNLPLYGDKDIEQKLKDKIIRFNSYKQAYEKVI